MTDTTGKTRVSRLRKPDFIVNYSNGGLSKSYLFSGSKNGRIDSKWIENEIVEYLLMNGNTFESGELVIEESTPEAKEIVENMPEKELYKANTISAAEVKKILKGTIPKMEAELGKIESKDTKKFVIDIAKEIKLDSNTKLTFLAEWYGVDKSQLFE